MSHSCPRCGFSCDCSGDWDDCEVMSEEWVIENCSCDCDDLKKDPDDDNDFMEDDDHQEPDYYLCYGCGYSCAEDHGGFGCPRCTGSMSPEYY